MIIAISIFMTLSAGIYIAWRWQIVKYIALNSTLQLIVAGLAFVAIIGYINSYSHQHELSSLKDLKFVWDEFLNIAITLATLLIAVFVWHNEQRKAWENSLPKKMDVFYKVSSTDQLCFAILNAPLPGEDDIRQWAQSLPQSLTKERLELDGFELVSAQKPAHNARFKKYQITIWLRKPIAFKHPELKEWTFDARGKSQLDPKYYETHTN